MTVMSVVKGLDWTGKVFFYRTLSPKAMLPTGPVGFRV